MIGLKTALYYLLSILKPVYLLAVLGCLDLNSGSTFSLPSFPSFSSFSSGFKLSALLAVFVNVRVIFAKNPSDLRNKVAVFKKLTIMICHLCMNFQSYTKHCVSL